MIERLVAWLDQATRSNGGNGPSSTKIVWLWAGLLSAYCATLATVGGVSVYVFLQKADAVYWGGVAALWTAALGFAGSVQRNQHQMTKEIQIAKGEATGTTDQGGKA